MGKKTYSINRKLLLAGDHREILRFGEYYSRLNNLPPIAREHLEEYLSSKPMYLGESSKGQWGMSFEDARRCLYDLVRTERLIQGIVAQLREMQSTSPRDIHVLEAGGGTGILAIVAALAGARQVTLLEINNETEKRTKAVIESLGLSNIITVAFANARNYIPEKKIDMLVCECLHTGLAFEPQLQIIQNLGKFLQPNAKLIPEGVTLRWALADAHWDGIEAMHTEYRTIQKNIRSIGTWSENVQVDFRSQIDIPEIKNRDLFIPSNMKQVNTVLVEMDVTVATLEHGVIELKSGTASFLGQPHAIRLTNQLSLDNVANVYYTYQPGEEFSHEIIPHYQKSYKLLKEGFSKLIQKVL